MSEQQMKSIWDRYYKVDPGSEVIGVQLPTTVVLRVVETQPSIKGATVTSCWFSTNEYDHRSHRIRPHDIGVIKRFDAYWGRDIHCVS